VNTVMNLQVPRTAGSFSSVSTTGGLSTSSELRSQSAAVPCLHNLERYIIPLAGDIT
jgi:hypothetical protein